MHIYHTACLIALKFFGFWSLFCFTLSISKTTGTSMGMGMGTGMGGRCAEMDAMEFWFECECWLLRVLFRLQVIGWMDLLAKDKNGFSDL